MGTFLKKCRERAGLKQVELAEMLNINQSDVSKYESGMKEPITNLFRDWTVRTQSMELGIAFLYGTEALNVLPQIMEAVATSIAGFINLLGGTI